MPAIQKWCCRALATLAMSLGLAGLLPAQNVLRVERDGKLQVVRKVIDMQAYVEEKGKLVGASGSRCVLQPVEEYLPVFIEVHDMEAHTSQLHLMGPATDADINNEFHFWAKLESPFPLDDVFLVLELDTDRRGKVLFYYEVGQLESRKPTVTTVDVPLSDAIGPGHFHLHLFTSGAEVFHSEQPLQYREGKLDRMVAKRIAGVKDAAPRPLFAPPPEYPPALRKVGLTGKAIVGLAISARGVVLDPAVVSATDPAFGAAALEVIRRWRFVPAVKDGHAIASKVDLPIRFAP